MTDPEAMQQAVALTIRKFSQIDVAFLNAGIEGPVTNLCDYSIDDFDKVMAVNVRGVFLGLKAVIPEMIEHGRGQHSHYLIPGWSQRYGKNICLYSF